MAERRLNFIKMDGLGNDFVIIDGRTAPVKLSCSQVEEISARTNKETGGCDQLIVLETPKNADVSILIYNADGGEVEACGNASRCVGKIIAQEKNKNSVTIETKAGKLTAKVDGYNVTVDMGAPRLGWKEIPVAENIDTINLKISEGELRDPVGVSMGNPHAVFFVKNTDAVNLKKVGPVLEHHKMFPQRANIGSAEVQDRKNIKLRVWERGVGETQACGTGACAAAVAAVRKGLTDREVTVHLPGGDLRINWDEKTNHVMMTGAVSKASKGELKL